MRWFFDFVILDAWYLSGTKRRNCLAAVIHDICVFGQHKSVQVAILTFTGNAECDKSVAGLVSRKLHMILDFKNAKGLSTIAIRRIFISHDFQIHINFLVVVVVAMAFTINSNFTTIKSPDRSRGLETIREMVYSMGANQECG